LPGRPHRHHHQPPPDLSSVVASSPVIWPAGSSTLSWAIPNAKTLTIDSGSCPQSYATTGSLAWKTDRSGEMRSNPQMKKSYGTPVVVKINGKDQIVSPASDWVYSYDPATGKELWKLSYGVLGFSVVPRPVVGNGFIYMSTGFMKPELLAIKYDGVKEPRIEWRISKGSTNMPSPILIGDEIYIVNDGGILLCANAHTGEEYYRERLGGKFSSSPIYADGKLYVGSREGIMFVVQPGKQFKILAQNTMEGAIMATPAAVDGALFVRTDKGLFRLGAKP
jgi:outer membrane protein assembly factor BamB